MEGTSSLFKVSKGRRWATERFGLDWRIAMPEQKNFKSSFLCPILCPLTCMKKLTRPVIESKQKLAEKLDQKFEQKHATQAGGCSARVPLPSERGGLPQRPRPNPLPLPPRASRCQPQGAPALQGRGIPGPGGWKLSNLLSAKFQFKTYHRPNSRCNGAELQTWHLVRDLPPRLSTVPSQSGR